MHWNWQQADWPNFSYNAGKIKDFEESFLYNSGLAFGIFQHLSKENQDILRVEIISNEALKTSEIEGEYLNRESLQSSILRQFGLQTDNRRISPAEKGITELMLSLYNTYEEPLSHQYLYNWHNILMGSRTDLKDIGCYRTSCEPMQIVSGKIYDPNVHFEAIPTVLVPNEMERFVKWFNDTSPTGRSKLPAITRSAIAHLYFESIHPFEDGNGRIGRAIAEKALSQSVGSPILLAISSVIEKDKRSYYAALERANKSNEISEWILYFAEIILNAQCYTQRWMEFLVKKAKFYEKNKDYLNPRQEKVIARIFREGPNGFSGGLSAENYISITKTSRPTATRDLSELVGKNILKKHGEKRYTRYYLNI